MMKKQGFFAILLAVFSLLLIGCQTGDSEAESPQQESTPLSLTVRVGDPNTNQQNRAAAFNASQSANFSRIDRITVEMKLDGTTVTDPTAMNNSGGIWAVTLDNILPNREYTFIAKAYESDVEVFNGSATQSFHQASGNQVQITLSPNQDVYLVIPKITQIIRPAQLTADTTGDILIYVTGSSNETLTYEFKKESVGDTGTFVSASGQVALVGSSGTIINSYRAPVEKGIYNFSVKVSNANNNSVEGKYQINVNDLTGNMALQINPVIHGIQATCDENQLILTSTAVGYNGTDSQLSWRWQLNGNSGVFQNPTENGAILTNYSRELSGPIKLYVTDNHPSGGTTIVTYQLEKEFCPLLEDINTLKLEAFDEYQSITTEYVHDTHGFEIGTDSFLVVANHNAGSQIYKWNGSSFESFQSISTNQAHHWESFQIGSEYYLAVANFSNGSSKTIDSKIYKWNGTAFEEFQSITTSGAMNFRFFQIGSESYLAVANHLDSSGRDINSKIYKWNGTSFVEFQSIATNGAVSWEFFTIDTTPYLVVANHYSAGYTLSSKIYKWNGTAFEQFQTIQTEGAFDWTSFRIGSDTYLAVANHSNGSTGAIPSIIYKWNGTSFQEFQSINTERASGWEFFQVGSDHFLVVANRYNDTSSNINSVIYKWSGSSFEFFRSIQTSGAIDWEFLQIAGHPYLVVSNHRDEGNGTIQSKIYKARFEKPYPLFPKVDQMVYPTYMWAGGTGAIQLSLSGDTNETLTYEFLQDTSPDSGSFTEKSGNVTLPDTSATVTTNYQAPTQPGIYNFRAKVTNSNSNSVEIPFLIDIKNANITTFEEFQAIDTVGATSWNYFNIGSRKFLAVSSFYDGSTANLPSKIYEWNGTSFEVFQSIDTYGGRYWESFQIGSDYFLAIANHHADSNYTTPSKIYKWNGTAFEEFQSIYGSEALQWEYFQIGADHYLAIANHAEISANNTNSNQYNTASKIYKWNGTNFVEFQSIGTHGAGDWEFFTIGSNHYLIVGNNYSVSSKVYKWNGLAFEEFQTIETLNVYDWHSFQIGTDTYLASAIQSNGSTHETPSIIYKWNGSSFEQFQSINTYGTTGWESFQIGSDTYLAVANNRSDTTGNIQSVIYKWAGATFEEFQRVETNNGFRWKAFEFDQQVFFAVTNNSNGTTNSVQSKIYKARFQ